MSNNPPVINKCDKCSKEVDPPQRCGRCRNQFYCTKDCQVDDWASHKFNCSTLPPGALETATVALPDSPVGLANALQNLINSWDSGGLLLGSLISSALGTQLAEDALTPDERHTKLRTESLKQLMAYRFPPSLDCPVYPGHPSTAPYNLRHQLTLIARALVLAIAASPNPIWPGMLDGFGTLPPKSDPFPVHTGPLSIEELRDPAKMMQIVVCKQEVATPAGVRLFAPKILAKPGQLSQGEYLALSSALYHMHSLLARIKGFKPGRTLPTTLCLAIFLIQFQLQAEICPELLEYTGEE